MKPIRAEVQNGRLVIEEPTDLTEGTVIDLVPADAVDALDEVGRCDLHRALEPSRARQPKIASVPKTPQSF